MITSKGIGLGKLLRWSGLHIVWLLAGSGIITLLYRGEYIAFSIPWLPISIIGTAVAFYVGFKNNQAYDRVGLPGKLSLLSCTYVVRQIWTFPAKK